MHLLLDLHIHHLLDALLHARKPARMAASWLRFHSRMAT